MKAPFMCVGLAVFTLANARDIDGVVQRRLYHARTSLLDKIAQVVRAPTDTEVLVVRKEAQHGLEQTFVVEDAGGSAAKGQTFSIAPKTAEQAIAQWINMSAANPNDLPSSDTVWKWYRSRDTLNLTPEQRLRVAFYSLLREAPFFYWLRECPAERIKELLIELVERRPSDAVLDNVIAASAFFGKRFHQSQVARVGSSAHRRLGKGATFPAEGPRSHYALHAYGRKGGKPNEKDLLAELDQIAKLGSAAPDGPELVKRWQSYRLDCHLYAQDQYK